MPGAVAADDPRPDRLDDLVEEAAQVAPALLEPVEEPNADEGIGRDERVDEGRHGLRVGQAEQVADVGLVEPVGGRRQQLVEHRLRVAHAAGREPRDEVDRLGRCRSTVRLEDPPQLALDLVGRQAPDVEPLEPGQDRRRELLGMGRREHEHDELGRLLERLQERVPGVPRDLVGLVEDVDLAGEIGRGVVDALPEIPDRVDAAVRCCVDLDEVHCPALADRDARRAGVARVAVLQVRAVDGLGEDPGERGLARPPRPDEQHRVRDAVGPHRVSERLDDRFLPNDLGERLRPPAAVDRLVRRGLGRAVGHRVDCPASCARGRANPRWSRRLPCTPRRPTDTRALRRRRLGSGRSAAPDELR